MKTNTVRTRPLSVEDIYIRPLDKMTDDELTEIMHFLAHERNQINERVSKREMSLSLVSC